MKKAPLYPRKGRHENGMDIDLKHRNAIFFDWIVFQQYCLLHTCDRCQPIRLTTYFRVQIDLSNLTKEHHGKVKSSLTLFWIPKVNFLSLFQVRHCQGSGSAVGNCKEPSMSAKNFQNGIAYNHLVSHGIPVILRK